MAGTSPRRSSRARTTQSQSNSSSATSSTSGRPERGTRSTINAETSRKSSPVDSATPDEAADDAAVGDDDTITSRRRTRAQDEAIRGRKGSAAEAAEAVEDEQEDDEAVRCICGFDEYPGPIPVDEDMRLNAKDGQDTDADAVEDLAGFFVQCDICKVWQHGACVGIMTEESSPDEYFCEQCRKDLHKIYKASSGQRYSCYLPLSAPPLPSHHGSRSGSSGKEGTRSPTRKDGRESRAARQQALNQQTKRRSTMNSRDAALEEEQLRRAIEASKADALPEVSEGSTRRLKRGRSDSEERNAVKRQRTGSRSLSPDDIKPRHASRDDDQNNSRNGAKRRNGASRNLRETKEELERAEREERDRLRAEAANKRKGRAERRRGDDDDLPEAAPSMARTMSRQTAADKSAATGLRSDPSGSVDIPSSSQLAPDTPPTTSAGFPAGSRSKRSHQKKGKGRNQYTKDRDEMSPERLTSINGVDGGNSAQWKTGDLSRLHSRPRGGFNSKVSMFDMKRRATAMFDFIARAQVEWAEDRTGTAPDAEESSRTVSSTSLPQTKENAAVKDEAHADDAAKVVANGEPNLITNQVDKANEFDKLSCLEMMDSLARDLVHWQNVYAPQA